MLAEALAKVVDLGQKAQDVTFHTHPTLPNKVFVRHGVNFEEKASPAPLRGHQLAGFDDFVAALKDKAVAPAPEVYVAKDAVFAFTDREERRSSVKVALVESARFALVRELQQPRTMQPKDAVKMLRLQLHGGNVGHVIQPLSRVDFIRTSSGRTNTEHGKESLGKSVEAAVQQAKDIPEEFDLAVKPWTTSGFDRYGVLVKFGLYLDLEAMAVELRVLPDEVERARNQALQSVANDLAAVLGDVPIFLGTP